MKPVRLMAWAAGAGIVVLAAQRRQHAVRARRRAVRWSLGGGPAGLRRRERAATSPVVVNSLSLQWREAACVVRTSYRVRDAWHIGARCWGEGAISNVPIKLQMRGERLLLGWAGARGAKRLRRCP